uniref:Uncharacterized protein n=1 Tax=Ciona intestinalis TaxID=7719 RepID=H2XYN1_CIOIN
MASSHGPCMLCLCGCIRTNNAGKIKVTETHATMYIMPAVQLRQVNRYNTTTEVISVITLKCPG